MREKIKIFLTSPKIVLFGACELKKHKKERKIDKKGNKINMN